MSDAYLGPENVDGLARMLMALLSEVWIMRDRMAVMEKLLEDRVGLKPGDIDDFIPDADFSAQLEILRDQVTGAVLTAPLMATDRSVDSILRRAGLADAADRLSRAKEPA